MDLHTHRLYITIERHPTSRKNGEAAYIYDFLPNVKNKSTFNTNVNFNLTSHFPTKTPLELHDDKSAFAADFFRVKIFIFFIFQKYT